MAAAACKCFRFQMKKTNKAVPDNANGRVFLCKGKRKADVGTKVDPDGWGVQPGMQGEVNFTSTQREQSDSVRLASCFKKA